MVALPTPKLEENPAILEHWAERSVELGMPGAAMAIAGQAWVGPGLVVTSDGLLMEHIGALFPLAKKKLHYLSTS